MDFESKVINNEEIENVDENESMEKNLIQKEEIKEHNVIKNDEESIETKVILNEKNLGINFKLISYFIRFLKIIKVFDYFQILIIIVKILILISSKKKKLKNKLN
jgi:hypothetical protein